MKDVRELARMLLEARIGTVDCTCADGDEYCAWRNDDAVSDDVFVRARYWDIDPAAFVVDLAALLEKHGIRDYGRGEL
jgi:hypothetical protein